MSGDEKERRDRLGRLVGVVLKEPFATEFYSDTPSPHTGAYRGWELNEGAFSHKSAALNSMQGRVLDELRQNKHVIEALGYQTADIQELANIAQYESGWFRFLVVACREYLCNPQVRQEIDGQLQAARNAGFDVRDPNMLVGSGAAGAIGTILSQKVSKLGSVGAASAEDQDHGSDQEDRMPVIMLLTIIISNIGLNAFCLWARDQDLQIPAPGDDQDTRKANPQKPQA